MLQYPVITAHVPSSERWATSSPTMLTPATNRNLLQPTKANKRRRESDIKQKIDKSKHRTSGDANAQSRAPLLNDLLEEESDSSGSVKSGRSQLVDLMVEDVQAEETERVRARKEGGSAWNEAEPKHFV